MSSVATFEAWEAWAAAQEARLLELYRTLNAQVFSNRLPEQMLIRVVGAQDSCCDAKVLPWDKEIWFVNEFLAFASEAEIFDTLLHEMTHIELYQDYPEVREEGQHGKVFEQLLQEHREFLKITKA